MAFTISLSYEDTFSVFDYVNKDFIGEVVLMSDGWAAYEANVIGRVIQKRIGTYENAEMAIRAVDDRHKMTKKKARSK